MVSGKNDQRRSKFDGLSINMLTILPHATSSGQLAAWFEEETGVHVEVFPVSYAEITGIAALDAAAPQPKYDIVQYWYPMLGFLTQKDILVDLTDWWEQNSDEIHPEDIIPAFRDTWCVIRNRRYGVPHDGDMHLLFYNASLFSKYDVKAPQTWDDYLEICKIITKGEKGSGVSACGIMGADIPLILIGTFLNRLASFGGNFLDEDGQPTINSPQALAALEHLLCELPYAVPEPTSVAFDEMLGPWLAGKVGMVEFWADLGKMTDDPGQSVIPHQWGIAPLPKGPEPWGKVAAPLNAGWSLGISTHSQKQNAALEFIKFCLRPETHLRICTINGGLDPVRWSTYDEIPYQQFVTPELANAARSAVQTAAIPWPTIEKWPEMQDILHKNLFLALEQKITPKQALDDTQSEWFKIRRLP